MSKDTAFNIDRNIDGHPICHDGEPITKANILEMLRHNEIMVTALARIMRWHGEFPETGEFFDEEKTRKMSYSACFGSNGERDYMRAIAKTAVTA